MAVRERVVEKNGHVKHVDVPGYNQTTKRELPKMTRTAAKKSSKAEAKTKPAAKPAKPARPAEKAAFKASIMALEKGSYKKVSEHELNTEAEFRNSFESWLDSGQLGEFIAIRRK